MTTSSHRITRGFVDIGDSQIHYRRAGPVADIPLVAIHQSPGSSKQLEGVMGELAAKLNAEEKTINDSPVSADQLGQLIARLKDGTISSKIAKQVFEACWAGEGDPDAVIEAKGLKQMSDSGELEKIVDDIIANNAPQVEDYRSSDDAKKKKKIGFFVGQAMKATQGKANPQQLNALLKEKLG